MTNKKCPYCGGNPKLMVRQQKFIGQYESGGKVITYGFYIKCTKCHARGGVFTITTDKDNKNDPVALKGAWDNWNMRV